MDMKQVSRIIRGGRGNFRDCMECTESRPRQEAEGTLEDNQSPVT